MKKLLLIPVMSLILFSCEGPGSKTDRPDLGPDTLGLADTIVAGSEQVFIERISRAEFDSASDKGLAAPNPAREADNLKRDSALITMHDSVYLIRLGSGDTATLVEKRINPLDESDVVQYTYMGRLGGIPFIVFECTYYESYGYMMMNLNTGKTFDMFWGEPRLSPDGEHVFSSQYDMESGFLPNGLQLFRLQGDEIVPLWQKELTQWGPTSARWADAKSICFAQETPGGPNGQIVNYARIILK
ncbi:MAG: hypothetical protein AB1458_02700 [Bacteroidota bacterium]